MVREKKKVFSTEIQENTPEKFGSPHFDCKEHKWEERTSFEVDDLILPAPRELTVYGCACGKQAYECPKEGFVIGLPIVKYRKYGETGYEEFKCGICDTGLGNNKGIGQIAKEPDLDDLGLEGIVGESLGIPNEVA